MLKLVSFIVLLVILSVPAHAQRRGRWREQSFDASNRRGVPSWQVDELFPNDLFTFVRIRYQNSYYGQGRGWSTDYPDSDLNFSLRLQQLTTLKVNPNPIVLELTDEKLFEYPFIYLIEPGSLEFQNGEVEALRRYCDNGGFLMIDDFWGDEEFDNLAKELKKVFPKREIKDVPLEHEIFHCVYNLNEKPQVPAVDAAVYGRAQGITWEPRYGSDTSHANYRAISDDSGRIMIFICHNTDLGDGWEKEGQNEWYFREFSVKKAYPMGINIIVYAMTH